MNKERDKVCTGIRSMPPDVPCVSECGGGNFAVVVVVAVVVVMVMVCEHECKLLPWFPADSWKHTDTTTEQLVAATCTNNLKVEHLIKLSTFIGAEGQLESYLTLCCNHPSVCSVQS